MVFTPQNLDQHVTLEQRQSKEKGLHMGCRRACEYWLLGVKGTWTIGCDQTMEITYDNMKNLDLSPWQQRAVDSCGAGKWNARICILASRGKAGEKKGLKIGKGSGETAQWIKCLLQIEAGEAWSLPVMLTLWWQRLHPRASGLTRLGIGELWVHWETLPQ